jgi:hypothetical protein
MKYFILLAMSLVFICLSACGEKSVNKTPTTLDTAGQVGDAVSVTFSHITSRPDASSDDSVTDVVMPEDAVPSSE